MVSIVVKGLDETVRKLNALQPGNYAEGVMQTAVEMVKNDIAPYPAASSANSPARRRWYERGYGSRWRRADGSIGGRRTSETLGRKWTTRVRDKGMTGLVGNNASYARYVQDHKLQARFHARRGWKTDKEVAERQGPRIARLFKDAMRRAAR